MDYGAGSGAVTACAGDAVDVGTEWVEALEQRGSVQWTECWRENKKMVVEG
jgi:hypothetical protein